MITEHRAGAVDLAALADELRAAGFPVSSKPDFPHVLCCGFHVAADGYIRAYHNGSSLNWQVADIIRRHVAPAVGAEPGGDA